MHIEGQVLATTERTRNNGDPIRTVDIEGLELTITDPAIPTPQEGHSIRAKVYNHWISTSKGSWPSREIKAWTDMTK